MNPLDLMQARTRKFVKNISPPQFKAAGGGMRFDDKQTVTFFVPAGKKAIDRAIRWHEALHANFTPACQPLYGPRRGDPVTTGLAWQGMEDARIHGVCAKRCSINQRTIRDEWTLHLSDIRCLRHASKDRAPMTDEKLCLIGIAVARISATIVRMMKGGSGSRIEKNNRGWVDMRNLVIHLLRRNIHVAGRFHSTFQLIMALAEESKLDPRPPVRSCHVTMRKCVEKFLEIWGPGNCVPPDERRKSEKQAPDGAEEDSGDGQAYSTMTIVRPTLSERALPSSRDNPFRYADTGALIRPGKLASAAIGPVSGLFRSRKQVPGGVVLIDLSGSMSLSQAQITEILRLAPAATIAGYSGNSGTGILVILAEKGRRCAKDSPIETRGGNEVDLPALRWLLRHPAKPKYLVTDLGFCSQSEKESREALSLATYSHQRGDITILYSADDAIQAFSKVKGGGGRRTRK